MIVVVIHRVETSAVVHMRCPPFAAILCTNHKFGKCMKKTFLFAVCVCNGEGVEEGLGAQSIPRPPPCFPIRLHNTVRTTLDCSL